MWRQQLLCELMVWWFPVLRIQLDGMRANNYQNQSAYIVSLVTSILSAVNSKTADTSADS